MFNICVQDVAEFLMQTSSSQLKVQAVCVLNAICSSVAVKLLPLTTCKLGEVCVYLVLLVNHVTSEICLLLCWHSSAKIEVHPKLGVNVFFWGVF